jgi:hypothetical protein
VGTVAYFSEQDCERRFAVTQGLYHSGPNSWRYSTPSPKRKTALAKKTYSKPEHTSTPFSEPACLVLSADELRVPILVIEDYLDDSISIQSAARREGMHGHLCTIAYGSRLAQFPCRESGCNEAIRPDFLLLDLRPQGPNGVSSLREVCKESRLASAPLVILTTGHSEAEFCKFCDQLGAWRMNGPINSAEVAQTLSAALKLWRHVPEKSPPH